MEAIGRAMEVVEPEDRELALLLEADRAAYAQQASLDTRAPVVAQLERHGQLDGSTPGERLVLASLAFERARASESATEAVAFIEGVLADGRLLGEQAVDVAGTHYLLLVGLLATDALDLAESCAERMLADARAWASIPAQAFVMVHRGWVSFRQGAIAPAEADARTTLELLTAYDISLGTRFALALLIEALIEGGELDAAEQALRTSDLGEEIPPGMANNDLLRARGLLNVALGRTRGSGGPGGVRPARRALGGANPVASRWRSRASLALAARGRRAGATDGRGRPRGGTALGCGERDRCRAARGRLGRGGRGVRGPPRGRRGARGLAGAARARAALTDLGAALRRANRRAEARGFLEEGLALAGRCGARALAKRARTELRAAGGRSSDPEGTGVEQLTASERRVAELAAEGLSNPEIAQALFVTRKTVETHLGHVYRKLDISGRGKLVHALGEGAPTVGG